MERNYHLFERQVSEISPNILMSRIEAVFTHRKDELVFHLADRQTEWFLRCGLNPQRPYLLLYHPQRIREPSTEFFGSVRNRRLMTMTIHPYDKLVRMSTDDEQEILLKFYGRDANGFLVENGRRIIDSFKKTSQTHFNREDNRTARIQDQIGKLRRSMETEIDHRVSVLMTEHLGGWNKLMAVEACRRTGIDPDAPADRIDAGMFSNLETGISAIIDEVRSGPVYVYYRDEIPDVISLIRLARNGFTRVSEFEQVNEAWKTYLREKYFTSAVNQITHTAEQAVNDKISYLERSLRKLQAAGDLEERKKEAEMIGNLILSFPHLVEKGMSEVSLPNLYQDEDPEAHIRVRLNPAKTPAENAQKYFDKYRDLEQKKTAQLNRRRMLEQELSYWKERKSQIEKISSYKDAVKLQDLLRDRGMMQDRSTSGDRSVNLAYSFNRLLLDGRWEVFIGKNAQNNELLTFKFAHKYDLWFHAHGARGAHVILRMPDRNSNPPPHIIEQVAAVAAWHSEAKHSGLASVYYTPVRYVRKFKRGGAGQVKLLQSESIMVEPKNYI